MWKLLGATVMFFVLGVYAGFMVPVSTGASALEGENAYVFPYLSSVTYTQLPQPQKPLTVAASVIANPDALDTRFAGMLLHVRWLLERKGETAVSEELKRLDRQVLSLMDDTSDDVRDLRDDINDITGVPDSFVIDNTGIITAGVWQGTPILDAYINDVLTLGAGSTFANNIVTPNAVLASGQADEYCLTYEGTGAAFEWQACGLGSLAVGDIDTSAKLASIVTDETGTGPLVFGTSPTFTGTVNAAAATLSSTLTMSSSAANIALGSNYLSGDGGDEGIFVDGSGNVGVGTSTPTHPIHVYGTNATVKVQNSTVLSQLLQQVLTDGTTRSVFIDANVSGRRFDVGTGPQIAGVGYFGIKDASAGLNRLVIDSSGNVGIGTTTPTAKLDVQGAAQFGTGNVNLITSGGLIAGLSSTYFTADTSANLASILTDETGTGSAVFSVSPTFTGTLNAAAATLSSTLTLTGTSANIALGSNYLSGDGDDEGIFVDGSGLVGINDTTPDADLDIDSLKTVGNIFALGAPSAVTTTGAITGALIDLNTNYTATDQSATGVNVQLPTGTNSASIVRRGFIVNSSGALTTTGGSTTYMSFQATNPGITQTAGTAIARGVSVTTSSITTGGTQVGYNVISSGVTAGSLFALNIGAITAGAGIETALNIGSGWDTILDSATLDITGAGAITGATAITTSGNLTMSGTAANIALGSNYLSGDGGDEGVFVSSTGNVGIGTTTPNRMLNILSPSGGPLRIGNSSTEYFEYLRRNSNFWGLITSGGYYTMSFDITNGNAYFGESSSRVGIGTTSPSAKLSVAGDSAFTGQLNLSGSAANIALGSNYLSGDGGDEGIFVDGSGNVGVGTPSPEAKLDVSADNPVLQITDTDGTSRLASLSLAALGGNWVVENDNDLILKYATPGGAIVTGSFIRLGRITDSLLLGTAGSEKVRIDSSGNFGIGTTSPYAKLSVVGNSAFTGQLNLSGSAANIALGSNYLSGDGGDEGIFVDGSGNVGVGTSTPLQKLQVFGDIRVGNTGSNGCLENYGGGVIGGTCTSDERLKDNIELLASSTPRSYLEAITALNPVTYTWNEEAGTRYGKNTNLANLGFIAQDVEEVFPELVSRNKDGYRQVDFGAFTFYLVEAMKELWTKVRGIDERVEDLEQENEYLKSRLDEIEDELNVTPPAAPTPEPDPIPEENPSPEPTPEPPPETPSEPAA